MDVIRDAAPRRRQKLLFRSVAGLAIFAVAGVAVSLQKPAAPSVNTSQLWIDTVRRGPLQVQVHAAGVLTPVDVEWIAAATDGRVARVLVLPGASIDNNSVLVELENPELQQNAVDAQLQLRAAEAELHNRRNQVESALLTQEAVTAAVRADYEEARLRAAADADLAQAGLISPLTLKFSRGHEAQLAVRVAVEDKRLALARESRLSDVSAAAARVDQLRALVALKQQQCNALHVRAARAGIVQEVDVEAGQRVTGGTVLAHIAAPRPLKAAIQVSEVQASQIAAGQTVDIDLHGANVSGVVSRIDPGVRNGSVTIDVALPAELPSAARPDLSVDATINIARVADAVYVGRPVQAQPNSALTIFKLEADGSTASRTAVRVGRASYNAIEITGGLAPGDRVILSDTSSYERFDRIRIVN